MAVRFDEGVLDEEQPDRCRQLRAEHANLRRRRALARRQGRRPGRGAASAEQVERWRRGCLLAVRLRAYWQICAACSARAGTTWTRRCGSSPSRRRNGPGRSGSAAGWATFQGDLARRGRRRQGVHPAGRGNPARNWPPPAATSTSTWRSPSPDGTRRRYAAGLTARQRLTACDDPHRPGLPGAAARSALPARRERDAALEHCPARTGEAQRLRSGRAGSGGSAG